MQQDTLEMENFKILRSIWKNTYDKILEIKVTNTRSWNVMKQNILDDEKKKIDNKFDKDYNEEFIRNKIQISKTRNEANLKKMTTKNNLVEKVIHDTLAKINSFAKPDNPRYRQIVKELLIEGMVKLLEPTCLVRVRRSDVQFVKGILKDCEKEFGALMKKETGNEFNCQLHMDESEFIPNESGGVHLLSKDKKLLVINDLESRLNLAKEQYLPHIKSLLFPIKK